MLYSVKYLCTLLTSIWVLRHFRIFVCPNNSCIKRRNCCCHQTGTDAINKPPIRVCKSNEQPIQIELIYVVKLHVSPCHRSQQFLTQKSPSQMAILAVRNHNNVTNYHNPTLRRSTTHLHLDTQTHRHTDQYRRRHSDARAHTRTQHVSVVIQHVPWYTEAHSFNLFCCVHWLILPNPPTIRSLTLAFAPFPLNQPWRIWVNI